MHKKQIENIMNDAINLAAENIGYTSPNPSVCAIAVDGDYNIIASAVTARHGRPHAETVLMQKLHELKIPRQNQLFLFTTLEPCSHYGKTPPCANAVVDSKFFNTVYIALKDPDFRVSGEGVKILQQANLQVFSDILTDIARKKIYKEYEFSKINKTPFITAKMAISLDGKIATQSGESKWLSGVKTKQYTDSIRYKYDGILVGRATYHSDNPSLSSKSQQTKDVDPKKFVLTSSPNFTTNTDFTTLYSSSDDPTQICKQLYLEHEINHLLVEGGAKTITNFIKNNLVNRLIVVTCPVIIGSEGINCVLNLQNASLDGCLKLSLKSQFNIQNDIIAIYEKN